MAGIGDMRSYVVINHYVQDVGTLGSSVRTLHRSYGYFANVIEQPLPEEMRSGAAIGLNSIKLELVKLEKEIVTGDEVVYNGVTYRINSMYTNAFRNRTFIYATANDRG